MPTAAALEFVGAATWAALSGQAGAHRRCSTTSHLVPHVKLGQQADLVLVAPATADLLARAATGRADDLLTNVLLDRPLPGGLRPGDAHRDVAAPGHPGQCRHAAEPRGGRRRPGLGPADRPRHRSGPAAGPRRALRRRDRRAGRPAIADAPPRRTWPGCRWSCQRRRDPRAPRPGTVPRQPLLGLMGWALARAAVLRGADVTLVAANVASPAAAECRGRAGHLDRRAGARPMDGGRQGADLVVMAAAPADFTPAEASDTKIKKSGDGGPARSSWCRPPTCWPGWSAGRTDPRQVLVGFAAETRTPSTACWSSAGPSSPARAATCWCSTRSATAWCSASRTARSPFSAADGAGRSAGRQQRHAGPSHLGLRRWPLPLPSR